MEPSRHRARLFARARSARGFTLVEMLMVVAIIAIMGGIAIGITPNVIRNAKGQSGASQVSGALRRAREVAISRRRNVLVTFQAPNQLLLDQVNVPVATLTRLEAITLEGRVEFVRFGTVADTPDLFGNTAAIQVSGGGGVPMFTSEGMFTDANGEPANATIRFGIPGQASTANAITILGATATIRQYRWDGSRWVE